MKVLLSVIEGPHTGKSFEFSEHDTFVVGRASYTHFRLPAKDPYFSRAHFLLEVNPPLCNLLDLSSSNGTWVNGQRVQEIELKSGDKIRGGDTVFQVQMLTAPGTAPDSQPSIGNARVTVQEPLPDHSSPHRKTQREIPRQLLKTGAHEPGNGAEEAASKKIPGKIGKYEIVREIGRGGMGTVYLAQMKQNQRQFAIKTVSTGHLASKRAIQQFLREASILKRLVHPNVVAFHDSGEQDGIVYFAMEYVNGKDAQQILQERRKLNVKLAMEIVSQSLIALDYAHAKGFVHRDIKPANLLVFKSPAGVQVKLSDFGLAKVYQASQLSGLTLHGEMGGSVGFMAPEQITNYRNTTPSADLYSAAATLYYLLTGKLIYDFPAKVADRVLMILQTECVPIRQRQAAIPESIANVIHKALNRIPDKRYADALQFREALQNAL